MNKVFGADKKKNLAFALAFILLWGGLVLWNFITPEQDFSQAENRQLATFPEYSTARLLDGDFMEDMNTTLNDQFVGRPYWVSAQSLVEYGLGKRELIGVYIGHNALFRHYPAEKVTITELNVEGINAFAARYGIPTTVMLVPSSTTELSDALPPLATHWDENAYIGRVYAGLDANVTALDVRGALADAGADAEPTYYRTDHHWTTHGAWLAYRQLAPALGLPVRDEALTIITLSEDFLGTNHSRTGFTLVTPETMQLYQIGQALHYETWGAYVEGVDPEATDADNTGSDGTVTREYDSIYFPEYLTQKDKYSYFLGPLRATATITTGSDSGKKLIIFKDSYAHCLVPMLLADYSEIRLVDLRSITAEDYGAAVGAENYDEALFLYSTDTFSLQVGPGELAKQGLTTKAAAPAKQTKARA